ncbi:hypothetical protein F0562_010505 [Nyssa sinensis]|uniref:Uncharacterized protein n=1 Tax=Nyssa sinensis TaxID=561372 RepID=A0A5J4ZZ11_9ASTE|nr:hypothetical protein F0562_010505 [Nyssa sinensis]
MWDRDSRWLWNGRTYGAISSERLTGLDFPASSFKCLSRCDATAGLRQRKEHECRVISPSLVSLWMTLVTTIAESLTVMAWKPWKAVLIGSRQGIGGYLWHAKLVVVGLVHDSKLAVG